MFIDSHQLWKMKFWRKKFPAKNIFRILLFLPLVKSKNEHQNFQKHLKQKWWAITRLNVPKLLIWRYPIFIPIQSNGFPWYWTHFLKIGFVVAGGGFYSYYNLQCIKLDKENRIQEKKWVLCIQKTFNAVFKNGFYPVLGSFPRLPK